MIFLGLILAVLVAGVAIYFFKKWQDTQQKLHEIEKKLAKESSPEDLENRFKQLSQETLDKQEKKSTQQLDSMLRPVRDEMASFKSKVEQFLTENHTNKELLNEKFTRLDTHIDSLSKEAKELSESLRGNAKTRGDWGEILLQRALEIAGLREGETFKLQPSYTVDGKQLRPDAVVHLPDERDVFIDSKVSLIDYDRYIHAENESESQEASKAMREAVQRQVDEVRKYIIMPDSNTPGFAIMFTPIEPAWQLLYSEHADLVEKAQRDGVLIMGPTNLLAALKVVDQLWLSKRKDRNVQHIITRAEKLHDAVGKLVGKVETALSQIDIVERTLQDIKTKIHGRQGVLLHARKLSEMGVKGKVELPEPDEAGYIEVEQKEEAQ